MIKVLQGTLQWLMGSPAGLKLNDPLNRLFGTCFLYLVNLWWSFLGKFTCFLNTEVETKNKNDKK